MSPRKDEAESTTNTLKSDSLALMAETENREIGDEAIVFQSLENELTPGTLVILARIETFDEYFHCCGRW